MLFAPAKLMSETSAKVGIWNRRCLAVFWGLAGLACLGSMLMDSFRGSRALPFLVAGGLALLISALGFYRGSKWGRVFIGLLVAPLVLFCFDRLMLMYFGKSFGLYFWLLCLLVAIGFYTWIFLFTGLDRDAALYDAERPDPDVS